MDDQETKDVSGRRRVVVRLSTRELMVIRMALNLAVEAAPNDGPWLIVGDTIEKVLLEAVKFEHEVRLRQQAVGNSDLPL